MEKDGGAPIERLITAMPTEGMVMRALGVISLHLQRLRLIVWREQKKKKKIAVVTVVVSDQLTLFSQKSLAVTSPASGCMPFTGCMPSQTSTAQSA